MSDEGTMTKGGPQSVPVGQDLLLEMAKQQGYVPPKCYMVGKLVFALQRRGDDPCVGCVGNRLICGGRQERKGDTDE